MEPISAEIVESSMSGLAINREPEVVLAEATTAAKALQKVVAGKIKPVKFNGEQYLEFEDWQTVGRFYGVTSKIVSTSPIEIGGASGFESRAVVIDNKTGREVSAAEAMCMNDEPNWSKKPLFQLRSMAQTRACSKALRNVLAWVVVLAGYKPTPAEEMEGMTDQPAGKPRTEAPRPASAPKAEQPAANVIPIIKGMVKSIEPHKFKSGKFKTDYEITGEDEKVITIGEWREQNASIKMGDIITAHNVKVGEYNGAPQYTAESITVEEVGM